MGKEKNYIVPAEKKCVLELMAYLTKYLVLEYLFPPPKKRWGKIVASFL